jgi:hypothetical protein
MCSGHLEMAQSLISTRLLEVISNRHAGNAKGQENRHFQISKANIMDMKAGSIVGRPERPVGVLRQAETRRADTGRSAIPQPSSTLLVV